ncbi:MAG: hypothetical protein WBC44_08895 [Planctomycetaceae bacterium]
METRIVNLFATVLTHAAPTANYRGESELNKTVIQKVTDGRFDYPIISPEAMRNALREVLAGYGLPSNRERLHDEEQLAVKFRDYPNPDEYADDFFFGYLVAAGKADRAKISKEMEKQKRNGFTFKRDSVLRMNLAKALEPFRHSSVFTQSPLMPKDGENKSAYSNATSSALLHRETAVTAFQYPFALNFNDCKAKPEWTRALLRAIGELNAVSGNHARSYYEFAPASLVARLSESLVAGYPTYCFNADGSPPDVVKELCENDSIYPPGEFYLGGELVKILSAEQRETLAGKGVTLDRDPKRLLMTIADKSLGPAKEGK